MNTRKADLQYLPENGFYYYATNPMTHGHPELGMWAIAGSLKIMRALTQEECDKILAYNNMAPQEWEKGKLNLADLGYTGEQNDAARKTLAPITYDDNGEIIPLSQRFDASKDDIRFSGAITSDENLSSFDKLKNKIKNVFTTAKNERTRNHMRKLLEQLSGYRIRTGRFAKGIAEVADDIAKVIRSPRAYDWEVILPAVGKRVAERLNLNPSPEMSDYVTRWFVDGATTDNSAEAKNFRRAMTNADDYYRNKLLEVREIFDAWNKRAPEEVVRDSIVHGKTEKPLTEKAKGFFDDKYSDFVEELYPVKQLVDAFEEELHRKLTDEENPYVLLRNYRGMAGRAKIMVEEGAAAIDALKASLPDVNFDNFKTIRMILESVSALEDEARKRTVAWRT